MNSVVPTTHRLAILLLAAAPLFAQSQTGSLAGSVLDTQAAPIPGVLIEARSETSGVTLKSISNDTGSYVFPNIQAGMWSVTAEKNGFKKLVRSNIQIFIAQRQVLDLQLEVGDVKQSIEVSASQTLLDTNMSERGQTLTPRMYQTLPLWSGGLQNPSAFLGFMAGVNNSAELSIAGSTGRAREQLIDGTSNVIPESGGTVFNPPSAEAFSEFKLLVGSYTAEYGRTGGGIEILTTKSGTNALHGTWAYSMRRQIWNAAGWSVNQNRANAPGYRPKDRLNATSGGVGGPVYIPKIYDGRNKTFFYFTSDNDLRPAGPTSIVNTVPTALMTQGNFSQLPQPIFDPATTVGSGATATRVPFAGNIIPTTRFSRIASNILPVIPAPSSPALTNNHAFVNTTQLTDHVWSLKFDHVFSDRNRVSYFQSLDSQLVKAVSDFDGPLGTGLGEQYQRPRIFRVNHDLMFSPTVMLHSTYGYSRTVQVWYVPHQSGFASKAGFPNLTGDSDVTPVIQFAGADGYTAWSNQQGKVNNGGQNNYTHEVNQGLTVIHKKHEFKMGWDMRQLKTFGRDLATTNGIYVFARNQTANPAATGTTGNSFASFLLGLPDSANAAATPVQNAEIRYQYYAFYFHDNWKVTPKLTLNLGLRYDIPINWYAPTMGSVSLTTPNPAANNYPGAYVFPGSGPNRLGVTRFWPTDFTNIGPRAGFAYQLGTKTVIRGGFAIFYEGTGNGGCGCTLGANGSFAQLSDGLTAPFQWDGGIPKPAGYQPPPFLSPSVGNGLSVDYMGPTFGRAPRVFDWSLSLQRQIRGFLVEADYAGNRGYRLNSTVDLNQVNPSFLFLGSLLQQPITSPAVVQRGFTKPYPNFPDNGTLAQSLRPYPQFLNVWSRNSGHGRTWYDSAMFKVHRRFGAWQFSASYVRSKSLGLMTFRRIFSQNQVYAQDMYNLTQPKSYLPFDQPNVFNFLSTFDLPVGKGKKYLTNSSRLVNTIIGNWTISNTHNWRSGNLLGLVCPNTLGNGVLFTSARMCNANDGDIRTGQERTTLDPNNPSSIYFNSAAFSVPSQFAFGTASQYNSFFRQPRVTVDNISLIKQFYLWPTGDGAKLRLQLSANAFNPFNRTNFGVNGTVGNANFGRATGPQYGPRIITMVLRAYF
ncbi:MAG: carboxypeptidase regulatory-like domain-containing protein [Acidobacteria bacterium]|nr:carboxypeptidase regulatory-like domain-containing protein [Acidobacteriota bacterium]